MYKVTSSALGVPVERKVEMSEQWTGKGPEHTGRTQSAPGTGQRSKRPKTVLFMASVIVVF